MSLSGIEIKKQIDEKNQEIRNLLQPNQFILNNNVSRLLNEIHSLQELCPHHFENGYCEFCNLEEETYDDNNNRD